MTVEIRRRTALLMSVGVPYSWSGTSLLPPPLLLLLLLRLLASAGLSAALSHVTRPEFASAGAAAAAAASPILTRFSPAE